MSMSVTDGTVSYDMPQGDRRGTEVDLYDFTYDGQILSTHLKGGLGQLTDGDYGETNFRLDTKKLGVKGYEWVGWKNDSGRPEPIPVYFKFDTVRNFSQVSVSNFSQMSILNFSQVSICYLKNFQEFRTDIIFV